MIFGARYIIYFAFLLAFFLSIKGGVRERKAMILAILSIPFLLLLIKGIHMFYFEPRPFVTYNFSPLINPVGDASFPSVHVSLMAVLASSYIYFKSKWALLFLSLMAWVGISRVYVGVHFPVDILGGVGVGLLSVILAKIILKFFQKRFFL